MLREQIELRFTVEIVVEEDGDGYHAYCPALKGLHTAGNTAEEALQAAIDAGQWYLGSLLRHRDPIPLGVWVEKQVVTRPASPGMSAHYPQAFSRELSVPVV